MEHLNSRIITNKRRLLNVAAELHNVFKEGKFMGSPITLYTAIRQRSNTVALRNCSSNCGMGPI